MATNQKMVLFESSSASNKAVCLIPKDDFPYSLEVYGSYDEAEGLHTLKVVAEEIKDLLRRYCIVYPDTVNKESEEYRCLVSEDEITCEILRRLKYNIKDYEHEGLKWITLKSKEE